jgi:nucleoside-diphosphate-sugar epimerase
VKVLVTGGSSLIGRHTVARLVARGDEVTTLQRRPAGLDVREVVGSVRDGDAVARACAGQDAIVHLAAKVGVTGGWAEYERTNVDGTTLLLEAAQRGGAAGFVHVSSPSVAHAGEALVGAGAAAADPTATRGHYATSKAMAEILALDASSQAFPVVAIRPHLVWGPGDTQLVGRIVERARLRRLALVGSGAALIDSTYTDNAADALVAAVDAAVDRAADVAGRAFVVSNGEPRTVYELVARIVASAGIDWTPRRVPAPIAIGGGAIVEQVWSRTGRADDPPMTRFLAEQLSTAHWFDTRETRRALRWEPRVPISEGFARLDAWFGERPTEPATTR